LLVVAKALQNLGYQLTFVGTGTALELARHFPFQRMFECDTSDVEAIERAQSVLELADGVVNAL
jgi:CheY-like chemotaxis protein